MNESEVKIFTSLCDIIEESEQMSLDVMDHLEMVLEKLDTLSETAQERVGNKNLQNNIDGIINTIMIIMSSMQAQDSHRQKIERVANLINPNNTKFANAKHITGDKSNDLVDDDELAALIAAANA